MSARRTYSSDSKPDGLTEQSMREARRGVYLRPQPASNASPAQILQILSLMARTNRSANYYVERAW
ncbi:hypothetical protein ACHAPV_004784 [Trichoderma viride]